MAGVVQLVGTPQGVPQLEKPPGGRHRHRLAPASRQSAPDIRRRIREGHLFTFVEPPEGCATPIPSTNNLIESWNACIRDMLRRHRGLSLVPADQGGVPMVPSAHRASGTRRVARGQRRRGRTNRGALPGSLGTQPAGRMTDDRNPDAIRHRHRLGRIPHPNRIPRHPRLTHHRTHTLAYNPSFPLDTPEPEIDRDETGVSAPEDLPSSLWRNTAIS